MNLNQCLRCPSGNRQTLDIRDTSGNIGLYTGWFCKDCWRKMTLVERLEFYRAQVPSFCPPVRWSDLAAWIWKDAAGE